MRIISLALILVFFACTLSGCNSERETQLEGKVSELEGQVSKLERKIDDARSKLSDVDSEVNNLKTAVGILNSNVNQFSYMDWKIVVNTVKTSAFIVETAADSVESAVSDAKNSLQ